MNYRHAFHAGNHADVLKHWALHLCLQPLAAKPSAFAMLDTHAGRGLYDLRSEAATRSPEWRDGVGRLIDWADPPADLRAFIAGLDGALYPGSPEWARRALRVQDRLMLCELHPEEAEALRGWRQGDRRVQVHQRDGFEAIAALTPPPEKRGLVLIDPPYEKSEDLGRCVAAIRLLRQRFRQAIVLWWRPLKDRAAIAAADAELRAPGAPDTWIIELDVDAPKGLAASSLMLINPPFGSIERLAAAGPALAARLAQGPGAGFRVDRHH